MTKPSYEELRITKHSGSPQIADSGSNGVSTPAATENRKPTIADLEAMLADTRPHKIVINPDGSIRAVLDEAAIWREAFRSALAFASPSPRHGVHRRGDRIFSRMMDLEAEANEKCSRELTTTAGDEVKRD